MLWINASHNTIVLEQLRITSFNKPLVVSIDNVERCPWLVIVESQYFRENHFQPN